MPRNHPSVWILVRAATIAGFLVALAGCAYDSGPPDTPPTLQGKIAAIDADPSLTAEQKQTRKSLAQKMADDYARAKAMTPAMTAKPKGQ